MDEDKEKSVCTEQLDRLRDLPDCLIFQILLNLPTKNVVKTSALSRRWKDLWRYVPGLDLDYYDFREVKVLVGFFDRFMSSNTEFCLQKFKFKFDNRVDDEHSTRLINTAVKRNVQHLHVSESTLWKVKIPLTLYTCESLVSLELSYIVLLNPEFVSLPSLRDIYLSSVKFSDDMAFERLVLGCPVLEDLTLLSCGFKALRVRSQSLLSFTLIRRDGKVEDGDRVVTIDTPRLKYLNLGDHKITSVITNNTASLVKLEIDIPFDNVPYNSISRFSRPNDDDLQKRNMIRNFLIGISSVKTMNIFSDTPLVIYENLRYEELPLFRNLSFLSVDLSYKWEALSIFLESCPNLKSLSMKFFRYQINIVPGHERFLKSLEYVKMEVAEIWDKATEMMKLVSYILENSPVLKRFTLCLGNIGKKEKSAIFEKLLSFPRLSTSCKKLKFSNPYSCQRYCLSVLIYLN